MNLGDVAGMKNWQGAFKIEGRESPFSHSDYINNTYTPNQV